MKAELRSIDIKIRTFALGAMWSLTVLASLLWNIYQTKQGILHLAVSQARFAYERDILIRRWNACYGGVYVPVTDKSPPNPYLDVPERDIVTPSGVTLTLINPAYMTRQVHELAAEMQWVQGHITSLHHISPANAPDPWERKALEAFERGATEVNSVEEVNGEPYLRLIRPLFTEEGCLRCHAAQGYKLSDIRGGISVSLPMAPLLFMERSQIVNLSLGHGVLLLLGLAGLWWKARRQRLSMTDRRQMQEALARSEEQFRRIVDSSPMGIHVYRQESSGRLLFVGANPAADLILGIDHKSLIGKTIEEAFPQLVDTEVPDHYRAVCAHGLNWHTERFDYVDDRIAGAYEVHAFQTIPGAMATLFLEITERKRAEEQLRDLSRFNQGVLDSLGSHICVLDESGTIVAVNQAWLDFAAGNSCGAVVVDVGVNYFAVCEAASGEDRQSAQEMMRGIRAVVTGEMPEFSYEYSCHSPDEERWFVARVTRFRYRGSVLVVVAHLNITALRRAEASLRENEEKMRSILRAAPVGIGTLVVDTLMEVNARICTMTGYGREELVGSSTLLLYPTGKDFEHVGVEQYRQILQNGAGSVETVWRRKDGSLFDVLLNSAPLDPLDPSRGAAFTALDISELKNAQQRMKESEEKLLALINASPDIICFKDASGAWIQANDSILNLYQIKNVDYHNKTEFELADYTAPIFQKAFRTCSATDEIAWNKEGASRSEEIIPDSEGANRVYDVLRIPLYTPDQSRRGLVVFGRDITELKAAQAEKDLLQVQFLQAQKMESVGRLAGGVAHDFNNKIQAILACTELSLLEIDTDSPVHERLQQVLMAAEQSADLTRQLLAFARKQVISPRRLDLNTVVSSMMRILQRIIGEDIELRWIPGRDIWTVRVDPAQIDQILANLVINGRDAIAGVGTICLKTENVILDESYCAAHDGAVSGEYVLMSVSDNGTGMGNEVLEHIFEPFFTTKEVGKGTGLGLATVYGIVKQNNGYIDVRSELDVGTTFGVYLPALKGKAGELETEFSVDEPPTGTETVLVVDDDEAIMNLGAMVLTRLGYTVLTASTPGKAIRLAGEYASDVHLLIADVVMPEMNGKELAQRLAFVKPGLKCLFMSGYTADVIAHHGVLADGVQFIQKPFSIDKIAKKIREVLAD